MIYFTDSKMQLLDLQGKIHTKVTLVLKLVRIRANNIGSFEKAGKKLFLAVDVKDKNNNAVSNSL